MVLEGTVRKYLAFAWTLFALLTPLGCRNNSGEPLASESDRVAPIVVSNSPLPTTPTPLPGENGAELRQKVSRIISDARKHYPGESSVVFIDVDSATRVDFAADTRYESASLMKLMVLAELYREVQVGNHRLDEQLVLLEKQRVGGSGHIKNDPEGTKYTLKTLGELMITESDNTATQMLTDLLGREKIAHTMKAIGLQASTIERDIYDFSAIDAGRDNYTTASDIASLLLQLVHQELPGSGPMNEILEGQKRDDVFGKGFPKDVRIAHKTGELDGILHDAAIVYAPRGTFILVALSDHVADKQAAAQVLSKLALDILKLYLRN